MKKLLKVAAIAAVMLFAGTLAHAQKVGYVNFKAVVDALPETKGVQTQLQAYQKQFADQFQGMQTEYNTKVTDFQKNNGAMNDATRTAKANEIQDIERRMQDFNNTAQQQINTKADELSKPLIAKAKDAITAIAKEKGYAYVLNTSQVDLIVSPDADDLMPAVKAKLGIK